MTDQEPDALSRYLDGEGTRAELPEELRREAEAFERIVAAMDRRPVRLPPTVRAGIMARVRAERGAPWRRAWEWVNTPRAVRFSPLTGALAVAALAGLVLLGRPRLPGPRGTAEAPVRVLARFLYQAPEASTVAVTGEFARWDPRGIPMRRADGGIWVAEVELSPGLHQYVFVVDGDRWVADPNATSLVDDGFGQQNSVLLIPERRAT